MLKVLPIILNWNSAFDTIECVKNILSTLDGVQQVLVIDNGSYENDQALLNNQLAPFPSVDIVWNDKNLGYAGGNNVGFRIAMENGYDALLLLNSDVRFRDPDTLVKLSEFVESNSNVGVIGPRIINPDGSFQHGCCKINMKRGTIRTYDTDSPTESDFVTGACIYITREAIEKVGLMDESFFLYWEESDYCYRVRQKGLAVIYYPFVSVEHALSVSTSRVKTYYYTRNRIHFIRRYGRINKALIVCQAIINAVITTGAILVGWLIRKKKRPGYRILMVWRGTLAGISGKLGIENV